MGNQKSKKKVDFTVSYSNQQIIKNLNAPSKILKYSKSLREKTKEIKLNNKNSEIEEKIIIGNKNNETQRIITNRKIRKKVLIRRSLLRKNIKPINIKENKEQKFKKGDIINLKINENNNLSVRSNISNSSENSSISLLNPKKIIINKSNSIIEKVDKEKYRYKFSLLENNENNNVVKTKNKKSIVIGKKYSCQTLYNLPSSYNLPQLTENQKLKESFIEDITSNSTKNTNNNIINKQLEEENFDDLSIDKIRGLFIKKPKNFKFIGTKVNNLKTNFGIIKWEDNYKLIGIFSENKINNFCKFSDCNSNSHFSGFYINNKPNGYGIFKSTKKSMVLEGEWENDKINGIGIQIWSDSSIYYGEFKEHKKNGIGTYKWDDGTIYYGQFNNDIIEGYGIFVYNDGKNYEGEVFNNDLNGFGIFSWNNKKKYFGFYQNGKKDGFGIYLNDFFILNCIIGFWNKGKINGPFIKIKNNICYYGLFRSGIKIKSFKSGIMCLKFIENKYKKYWNLFNMNSNQLIHFIYNLIMNNKS